MAGNIMLQLWWLIMSIFYVYFIRQKIIEAWYSKKNFKSFNEEENLEDQDFFSRMLGKPMKDVSGVAEFFYLLSTRLITLALKITNTVYIFLRLHTLFVFQVVIPKQAVSLILSAIAIVNWFIVVVRAYDRHLSTDLVNQVLTVDKEIPYFEAVEELAGALDRYRALQCRHR